MIAMMQSITNGRCKVDGKVKKVKSVDVEKVIELFNEQVNILKAHISVKRTQNTYYNRKS